MLLRSVLLFTLFAEWGLAISVNRTIDDRYGDSVTGQLPQFMPNPWSNEEQCQGCYRDASPDPKECHNGTWSYMTHYAGDNGKYIKMQFTGTAVYAYHILGSPISNVPTNLAFTLDGAPVGGEFLSVVTASDRGYQYNVPVYVNESLENIEHTFVIHLVGPVSLGLFDYLVYTFDDGVSPSTPTSTNPTPTPTATAPSSVPHRSRPIGAAIGGSVGGAVLILVIIATVVIRRRKHQRRMSLASSVDSKPRGESRSSFTPEKRVLGCAGCHSRTSGSRPHAPADPDHRSSNAATIGQAVSLRPGHPMPVVPEYPMSGAGYTEASLISGITKNFSVLRNEVAVLRDEIVRLRHDQETVTEEAPPQYESPRGSRGSRSRRD
ncbi:hypothetical protein C8Q74DRAFT_1221242 [Fomes fomentarius]|nr:hypothetical protein C8Q74DRAFT_1221242 [Fomes fomentarius]